MTDKYSFVIKINGKKFVSKFHLNEACRHCYFHQRITNRKREYSLCQIYRNKMIKELTRYYPDNDGSCCLEDYSWEEIDG